MAEDKRPRDEDADKYDDVKKQKLDVNNLSAKQVLVLRLMLRYVKMKGLPSNTYCSFRPTRIPTNQLNNMGWLQLECRMMVGGGFVVSVAMQISLYAGTYQQPRENGRRYRGWIGCILQRATTGLVRKMAVAYYEAGKALMFSKKFAMGASFLEKAIELDHNGARALLAYYLMRGREGLPGDPERASDLAYEGGEAGCSAGWLILCIQRSCEALTLPNSSDSWTSAMRCFNAAKMPGMKADDPDLVTMLRNFAQGLMLMPNNTLEPKHLLLSEAINMLMKPQQNGIPYCEIEFWLGMTLQKKKSVEHERVAFHLTNAAKQGHPEALFELGYMYRLKCRVPKDDELFLDLMRQAKNAGSKSPNRWGFIKE
jgi:hypothetical protein